MGEASGVVVTDHSGNGFDGTYRNGVTLGEAGTLVADPEMAARFDGIDDYVGLPSELLGGASDLSIECWLQTWKSGEQAILSGATVTNDNEILISLTSSSELRFYTGEAGDSWVSWAIPPVRDGRWHHVAIVRDASNSEVELYVDGVSRGARQAALSPLAIDSGGLIIGQDQDAVGGGFEPNQSLNGLLDEVAIFDQRLSGQRIAEHYHARYAADPNPPVVVGIDPLPVESASITALVSRLTLDTSKEFVASAVNDPAGWELRSAGADADFGTSDDTIYPLAIDPPYGSGTTIVLNVADGPLPVGQYRFAAAFASALSDYAGSLLDGNGDGTGGDDLVRTFQVVTSPGLVLEVELNNARATATDLDFVEDPFPGGYFNARGLGAIDPAVSGDRWSDPDYWRFEASAGDRVAVAVDTPDSDVDPYVELRSGADDVLATDVVIDR
jgi:hypothetical protein